MTKKKEQDKQSQFADLQTLARALVADETPSKPDYPDHYLRFLRQTLNLTSTAHRNLEPLQASSQGGHVERMQSLSVTDGATGILNRRGFQHAMDKALSRARRNQERGHLVTILIIGAEDINSALGAQALDLMAANVAAILINHTREVDSVGRLGPFEFGVILTGIGPEKADEIIDEIKKTLNNLTTFWQGQTFPTQADIGVIAYGNGTPFHENSLNQLQKSTQRQRDLMVKKVKNRIA